MYGCIALHTSNLLDFFGTVLTTFILISQRLPGEVRETFAHENRYYSPTSTLRTIWHLDYFYVVQFGYTRSEHFMWKCNVEMWQCGNAMWKCNVAMWKCNLFAEVSLLWLVLSIFCMKRKTSLPSNCHEKRKRVVVHHSY